MKQLRVLPRGEKMSRTLLAAVPLILLLLSAGAAAQTRLGITGFVSMIQDEGYVPLEEDLIVVEVTPEGIPVEKRLAKEADLFFYRQLRTKLLFGVGGVKGYESELVLSLRNVSGRKLENVGVIETIPAEMAARAADLASDSNFLVLNEQPAIIEFFIDEMVQGQENSFSYRFSKSERMAGGQLLESMAAPKALIKLEEESCIGIVCKDLDPCTRDYCRKGECFFEPLGEGTECGENMQCIAGSCVSAAQEAGEKLPLGMELLGLAFLVIAIVFAVLVLLAKARGKRAGSGK